jgi:hypothetical protein
MRHRLAWLLAIAAGVVAAACGSQADGRTLRPRAPHAARWSTLVHAGRPLDVAGPLAGGSTVLAAAGRLFLLTAANRVEPYAPGYRSPGGEEPYIALSPGGCFGARTVYALRLTGGRGVVAIDPVGHVRRVAAIGAPGLIDGIAFDTTGGFAHRLLVTINAGARTTVDAIDCRGRVTTITGNAPRLEGGIAVAPRSFGRFAGDLIAPSETTGLIWAISPNGRSVLVGRSGLQHGGDIGVESEGFVPGGAHDALLADRFTPGNRHPGDNVVLRIRAGQLAAARVRPGDLLVATEGGALTDDVRCNARGCRVRLVATGPSVAHAEGHIAFRSAG